MLVSFSDMRVRARRFAAAGTLLFLPAAGCSGGDLLLPDRAPEQLRAVSGDGQSAVVGSPVPNPLVVAVLDGSGRPVEGAVIVFEFVDPPNGAVIAPQVSQTDPEGLAAAEVTLGAPAGDQPVEAKLDNVARELSVRFLLTAIPFNGGGGGGDDDDGGGGDSGPPDDGGGGGDGDEGNGGGGNDDGGNGGGDGGGGDDDRADDGNGGGGDDDDDDERDGGRGGGDDDDGNSGSDEGNDGKGGEDQGKNEKDKAKGDREDDD